MPTRFALAFALALPVVALAQATPPATPVPPSPDDPAVRAKLVLEAPDDRAKYVRAHYAKYEFRIPMRDGTRLFTSVYVPNDAGPSKKYPMLMVRTPYSVAPYGLDRYRATLGPTADYEKDGFIFVHQDVRGRNMSEGEFVNMRPHVPGKTGTQFDESSDTHDTITWLLEHVEFHNGRVGLWGISYPGFYATMGAIDSHPALKAVSPQAPIADWWIGDDMHRNGAFNLQMAFAFFSGFDKPRPVPAFDEDPERFAYGTPDAYRFFLDLGPLSRADTAYFKGERAFWREVSQHPDYDAFWQARNVLPHLSGVRAATLVVGGFFDTEDLYGPLQTYAAIERRNPRAKNSLVMGPWCHGCWRGPGDRLGDSDFGFPTGETFQPLEYAFFKHHLKDDKDPQLPEAMVFETGANRWRRFDAWPPKGTRAETLYLAADGVLARTAPTATGDAFDDYPSDPAKPVPYTTEVQTGWSRNYMGADQRFASSRPDVLVYRTEPLTRDVTIAGPIEASFWFASTSTDADLVIKLVDVAPGELPGWTDRLADAGKRNRGGMETLVRGEPFRLRYRDDPSKPKPLVPNEPTHVAYTIDDVLHTFKRGHRIMVQVQSTWFPFIDRNPQRYVDNIFDAKPEDFVRATHRVHRDAAHPSALTVRILPAADD